MFKVQVGNLPSSIVYYRNIKSIVLNLFSSVISEYIYIYIYIYISINNLDISYFN